jgi:ABC-type sulfate/molybdate transport systems ATPase subunit
VTERPASAELNSQRQREAVRRIAEAEQRLLLMDAPVTATALAAEARANRRTVMKYLNEKPIDRRAT